MSERLTTPREHLGVLVEPAADALATLIATDRSADLRSVRILNTSAGELRAGLRRRLGLTAPVILTGHQAEFCHAGVFAKTIAVSALVAQFGGSGVFLTVDSDTPKETRLAAPRVVRGEVRRSLIPIPGCDARLPLEWQPRVPALRWREFFDRLAETIGGGETTLLAEYASGALSTAPDTIDVLDALKRGHAAAERRLGIDGLLDVRISRLSETPEFRAFVGHLLLNAGAFAEQYNAAQRAYRRRRRERNPHRPVPLLAVDVERVELPLWVSRTGAPRRRLFVALHDDRVELFADDEPIGAEPLSRVRRFEECGDGFGIERDGWHLRPRALALSAFTRLFLSDLFVHGIGGAKYDEMTEDFIRRFCNAELPAACCVTATAHLPLPTHGVNSATLAAARHARRDIRYNPQRHLRDLPPRLLQQRETLVAMSQMLRREPHRDSAARRRTFDEIRAVSRELLRTGEQQVAELERAWDLVERHWRADRVAFDREYFFALHPRTTLEALIERIHAALGCVGTRC